MRNYEHRETSEWERVRYLAFATYTSTVSMSGKQAFKLKSPTELFELANDSKRSEVKYDPDRANKARERYKKVLDASKEKQEDIQ